MLVFSTQNTNILPEARAVSRVPLPLLRYVVPLNDGNCRLTMPAVKERCARDALIHPFNLCEFKSVENNSTTIKHNCN